MSRKIKKIEFVLTLILIFIIPLFMVINIIFSNFSNDCYREIDKIRDDRTYDYFNLLRLYLIEDTQFETDVSERIVDKTIYLRDDKNLEKCENFSLTSDISIYVALILYLILLIFYVSKMNK